MLLLYCISDTLSVYFSIAFYIDYILYCVVVCCATLLSVRLKSYNRMELKMTKYPLPKQFFLVVRLVVHIRRRLISALHLLLDVVGLGRCCAGAAAAAERGDTAAESTQDPNHDRQHHQTRQHYRYDGDNFAPQLIHAPVPMRLCFGPHVGSGKQRQKRIYWTVFVGGWHGTGLC